MLFKREVDLGSNSPFSHLLVKAICQVGKKDEALEKKLIEAWHAGGWDLVFKIEGVDIDIREIMEEWDRQLDHMVIEEAKKLVAEKMGDVINKINDTTEAACKAMQEKVEESLGVKIWKDE